MNNENEPHLYVSPGGSDSWTGFAPEQRGAAGLRTEGPLRTVRAAVMAARELRRRGRTGPSVRVRLRGGVTR